MTRCARTNRSILPYCRSVGRRRLARFRSQPCVVIGLVLVAMLEMSAMRAFAAGGAVPPDAIAAADKVVKVYGAGGLEGLEAYQSGILIDATGLVLTTNSLVLDQGEVTIVTHLGDRYSGKVLGADPFADVAVVKIDPAGEPLPAFDLTTSPTVEPGEPVFILANAFGIAAGDEPVTLQQSILAGVAPLRAKRGVSERIDGGDVLLFDAVTSNPGAAGGAVVDHRGRLLAVVGRELKSRVTGAWLNYALPAGQLRVPVERILQGDASASSHPNEEPPTVDLLTVYGFAIVAEIVPRTPAFVEFVRPNTAASEAGLEPDDLALTVDGLVATSTGEFHRLVARRHAEGKPIQILLQRGEEFIDVELPAPEKIKGNK